jgi:coproporphyrinogen III oxidase-like Fe-S oxidoreductase
MEQQLAMAYLDQLRYELQKLYHYQERSLISVYFGGGTPSLLSVYAFQTRIYFK